MYEINIFNFTLNVYMIGVYYNQSHGKYFMLTHDMDSFFHNSKIVKMKGPNKL